MEDSNKQNADQEKQLEDAEKEKQQKDKQVMKDMDKKTKADMAPNKDAPGRGWEITQRYTGYSASKYSLGIRHYLAVSYRKFFCARKW